jgi:beta-galactosidase
VCSSDLILGRRKPQSFYREALWRTGVLYVAVHRPLKAGQTEKVSGWGWPEVQSHWTWPGWEGQTLKVEVYSSCDRVRLSLNGKDLGKRATGWKEKCKADFEVPYEPGELKAVGTLGGKRVEFTLRTAGQPTGLRLTADRTRIQASRNDLSFVEIEVVDAKGMVVPHAEIPVTLEVTGQGELAAVGNANPVDMASFQGPVRKAWQGSLQAILQPTGKSGQITLKATAEGLKAGTARVTVR